MIDSLLLGLHNQKQAEIDWLREAVNHRFTTLTICISCCVLAPKSIDTHEHQEPKKKKKKEKSQTTRGRDQTPYVNTNHLLHPLINSDPCLYPYHLHMLTTARA
jgi:disulfide oxidoreductase YuzD